MHNQTVTWSRWCRFFTDRSDRKLPALESTDDYEAVPKSVARSLAVFQLGESGGGTIVEQASGCSLNSIDGNYIEALRLFVAEEHRHAEILAICVRNLGGSLIRKNWTARLFVAGRRLIGLRTKVLVLLAAEVVGICYYHLIATRMPQSRLKSLLAQIVNDERAHLHFHCDFLQIQANCWWRRVVFIVGWRMTMTAAAVVVLIDHRRALKDLQLSYGTVWRRWATYSRHAEKLVLGQNRAVPGNTGLRLAH